MSRQEILQVVVVLAVPTVIVGAVALGHAFWSDWKRRYRR